MIDNQDRRSLLKKAAVGGLDIFLGYMLLNNLSCSPKTKGEKNSAVVPPSWSLDTDSMKLNGTMDEVVRWMNSESLTNNFDYDSQGYGAREDEVSLYYIYKGATERTFVPKNGAQLHVFGRRKLDSISEQEAKKAEYLPREIEATDQNKLLESGTVVGIKTKENYTLIQISYIRAKNKLSLSGILKGLKSKDNFYLKCQYKQFAR